MARELKKISVLRKRYTYHRLITTHCPVLPKIVKFESGCHKSQEMSLDQIFSTAQLNVLVPDSSIKFPPNTPVDKWLAAAQVSGVERRQAFYG